MGEASSRNYEDNLKNPEWNYIPLCMIECLKEWYETGNDHALMNHFPDLYTFLKCSDPNLLKYVLEHALANKRAIACKTFDALNKKTHLLPKATNERPYDIVARYDDLIMLEVCFVEYGLLDANLKFIKNKKKSNNKCLAGIYMLLIENGFFKKHDTRKLNKKPALTCTDIQRFLDHRYGVLSNQTFQKRKEDYREFALIKFPVFELCIIKKESYQKFRDK